jgi:hypothetical protein
MFSMQTKFLLSLSVLIIFFFSGVHAQIKKGALLLGGQLGFSTQTTENGLPNTGNNASNYFTISPAFGKAIKENLLIGADITFSHGKNQLSAVQEQLSNTYGAGLFIRTYRELGKGFYLFGQARMGGAYGTQKYRDITSPNSDIVKSFYLRFALYPGVSYTLSRRLQIEAGFNNLALISYAHTKSTTSGVTNYSTNSVSASSSLSSFAGPTIGFQVLFN